MTTTTTNNGQNPTEDFFSSSLRSLLSIKHKDNKYSADNIYSLHRIISAVINCQQNCNFLLKLYIGILLLIFIQFSFIINKSKENIYIIPREENKIHNEGSHLF